VLKACMVILGQRAAVGPGIHSTANANAARADSSLLDTTAVMWFWPGAERGDV
jgi:hypothetical protein